MLFAHVVFWLAPSSHSLHSQLSYGDYWRCRVWGATSLSALDDLHYRHLHLHVSQRVRTVSVALPKPLAGALQQANMLHVTVQPLHTLRCRLSDEIASVRYITKGAHVLGWSIGDGYNYYYRYLASPPTSARRLIPLAPRGRVPMTRHDSGE